MVQHIQPSDEADTGGPSLATLAAVVVIGCGLAGAAAFYVRPTPKLDDKSPGQNTVVSASSLTIAPPRPAPAPDVAPKVPSLPPDRERLALTMALAEVKDQKTRSLTQASSPAPVPPAPAAGVPGASAFAPTAAQSDALQPLNALVAPKATSGADAERQKMAEDAARAIRAGDIPGARSILEKSLAAGDQTAYFALAETYDPVVLSAMKIKDVKPDAVRARELYEQAQKAGAKETRRRLAALKRFDRRN